MPFFLTLLTNVSGSAVVLISTMAPLFSCSLELLEQVSRLVLDEDPQTPQTPQSPCQSPTRKRKPSFIASGRLEMVRELLPPPPLLQVSDSPKQVEEGKVNNYNDLNTRHDKSKYTSATTITVVDKIYLVDEFFSASQKDDDEDCRPRKKTLKMRRRQAKCSQ